MNYRIYLKTNEMKTYKAIGGGSVTNNLIYAEMWDKLEDAIKAFDSIVSINDSSWKWQLRDVNKKVIKQSEDNKS